MYRRKYEEQKQKEYFNEELSKKEKELGNEEYRKGNYPEAVKHYTEVKFFSSDQ